MESITRRVQLKELDILRVFQDICEKHGLRYFAIGGTCIGAVRHKGFIPWDDDIDVAMPYEDYVKFIALAGNELPKGFGIMDSVKIRNWKLFYYIKIQDTNTSFIEGKLIDYPDRYGGLFIDIFPVHGFPSEKLSACSVLAFIHAMKKLNHKIRLPYSEAKSYAGKLQWFLSYPLRWLLPYYYFSRMCEKFLSRYPFGYSDKVIFPWRREKPYENGMTRNIFMHEDFRNTLEVPFEDRTIRIPAGYDNYLRSDFGDYMTLPPVAERISHNSEGTIIDFDRPYTYYIAEKEAGRL